MKPVIVMPMNDPDGLMFPHLRAITPPLKSVFANAFVSVPRPTREKQPEQIAWLKSDAFFQALYHDADVSVGEDFLSLFAHAASSCRPSQLLHLCFVDRVAFALQTGHRKSFIADVQSVMPIDAPLIFARSESAWATHPRNYRQLEHMITQTGEILFSQSLDFAWLLGRRSYQS